ncbi:benzoate/H(+) symporter BenE family transporter [Roseococcus sp. SDR]|uniref:benzoate/H(+) symporter BenE family transporter n=1 Tax=Roseococcus sp. SDR TaxID=2835532 RepID=UPI001BCA8F00|nr:benzoate/H(+) symporter BenE family transporter [Roseococcus sp. SDR]MBS7789553.1 benzoate/H(+) symporter BenE family transporter [Roseococcus sp. SDR]MBV1844867.1 benzoate/H(+) symporter BenE family transporter [Roseococcus sp. SDR]
MLQPILLGLLAAFVGFASSFAVVLAGFAAMGATPEQAASGLIMLCLLMGVLGAGFSIIWRMPVSIAWSTPGAALLVTTGAPAGGFSAAVGAFLAASLLLMAAGLWRPVARAVERIPPPIAAAMLAGVLLDLCLAPVRAVGALPWLALPVVLAWAVMLKLNRLWAVPAAVVVAVAALLLGPGLPGAGHWEAPRLVWVAPSFEWGAMVGIALPLFLVTMASQNLPGYAVLQANGYKPEMRPVFLATGGGSFLGAFFGGQLVNLAAITAALCAGPESHPDPQRRWVAGLVASLGYLGFALLAGVAAAVVAAAPPLLIQAVAGLALLASLAGALTASMAQEPLRVPAIVTFVVSASGLSVGGIGAAFWGLVAGGALMWLLRAR